jgi:hypothetical protein
MKQYVLNVIQPDGDPPPPEVLGPIMRDVATLLAEMKSAGAWVHNGALAPSSAATVVRIKDGEVLTIDGPFAEGKEHIGGFMIINARDLDAALEWARKATRAITLPIEVRPFRENG